MGVLDKLKFWKKEDSFAELDKQIQSLKQQSPSQGPIGLGTADPLMHSMDTGLDYDHPSGEDQGYSGIGYGMDPSEDKPNFSRQPTQSFAPTETQSSQGNSSTLHAQMEVIAAKLDTIRVSLESINHRLVAVERALHVQEYEEPIQPRRRRGSW